MKRVLFKLLTITVFAVTVFTAVSCASVPYGSEEKNINMVLDLLNNKDTETVLLISGTPFLLDEEILLRESDVSELWEGLFSAGFKLTNYSISEIIPLTPDSINLFSKRWEIGVLFRNYLPANGTIVRIDAEEGGFLFILGDKKDQYPEFLGIKGPL